MKSILTFVILLLCIGAESGAGATSAPTTATPATPSTPTGILLDAPWKKNIYAFAVKNVVHPSWGVAHSERDYQTTLILAKAEGMAVDSDVLFAASFLHDLGGIGSFQKQGVDHAVRSAELAGDILNSAGFPMAKLDAVKDMILGHTYYGPVPQSKVSFLFRDADILDFLGSIGVIRIVALTEEQGRNLDMRGSVSFVMKLANDLPPKLTTSSARKEGAKRVIQMQGFVKSLGPYTFGGKAI